jgi:hypothetical protein
MDWKKNVLAMAVVAGTLGVGAAAMAQSAGGCEGHAGMMRSHMRDMAGDPAAFAEKHLAGLKADLKITTQQEALWQDFASKAKDGAGKGFQAARGQSQDLGLSAPERMAKATEMLKQRVAAMETVNESFKHLYDSLSPEQKRAADFHATQMARMRHGHGMRPEPTKG